MKRIERSIYIVIIIILGAVIVSTITYIVMTNKDDKKINNTENNIENNDNEKLSDKIEFKSVKEENNKIIETYNMVLNGKSKDLIIEYSLDESQNYFVGKNKDTELYLEVINDLDQVDEIKRNLLKRNFQEDDFYFIKDSDNKTYLGIAAKDSNEQVRLTILNDELQVINKNFNSLGGESGSSLDYSMILYGGKSSFKLTDGTWAGYDLQNDCPVYLEDCHVMLKIIDNKIYYLVPVIKSEEESYIEERIYTINNSKMEYKVNNKYDIMSIVGSVE